MADDPDYYEVLHVRPDAPAEIIRASFRTLMHTLRMHPDRGGDTAAAAHLTRAYQTLTDPQRRAEYDRARVLASSPIRQTETTCLFCDQPFPAALADSPDSLCGRCGSPLSRATRHRFERSSRRMLSRSARRGPLQILARWGDRPTGGTMLDLSLNGLLFEGPAAFDDNRLLRLDSEHFRALARVSHCRPATDRAFRIGAEFVTLLFHSARGTFVSERA